MKLPCLKAETRNLPGPCNCSWYWERLIGQTSYRVAGTYGLGFGNQDLPGFVVLLRRPNTGSQECLGEVVFLPQYAKGLPVQVQRRSGVYSDPKGLTVILESTLMPEQQSTRKINHFRDRFCKDQPVWMAYAHAGPRLPEAYEHQ